MTDLKTPYLDRVIEFLSDSTFINSDDFSDKLKEYQSIKEALKRLEKLEEAAKKSVKLMESASPQEWIEAIETLKTVLEK